MDPTPLLAGTATHKYRSRFLGNTVPRTEENTRSVTVKQVQDACSKRKIGGRFILNNSQLYTVILLGMLREVDQNENHTNFVIYDGTGALDARIWPRDASGRTDLSGSSVGAYYKFICRITIEAGKVLMITMKATLVTDYNEITLHMLTTIHEACMLDRLRRGDLERWETVEVEAKRNAATTLGIHLDKEAIINFLSSEQIRAIPQGVTEQFIIKELHLGLEEGRNALQSMINEGSVYNTIDYDHFAVAD